MGNQKYNDRMVCQYIFFQMRINSENPSFKERRIFCKGNVHMVSILQQYFLDYFFHLMYNVRDIETKIKYYSTL